MLISAIAVPFGALIAKSLPRPGKDQRERSWRALWKVVVLSAATESAPRIEALDMATLGTCGRVDHGIDECGLFGHERVAQCLREAGRVGCVVADATKRLHHLVIACVAHETGRRATGAASRITPINSVIVEDDCDYRQLVAADRFDLHAAKTKSAVALNGDDRLAGDYSGTDSVAHADAHHAPGARIETVAGLVDVDDVAGKIERVGALVDDIHVRPTGKRIADGAQRTMEVHRIWIGAEMRRHPLLVLPLVLGNIGDPGGFRLERLKLYRSIECCKGGLDVTDHWGGDGTITVHLGGRDVDLYEAGRFRPERAPAVREQPVEAGSDQHGHIGVSDCV